MIWFLFISENAFLSVAVTFETVGGGLGDAVFSSYQNL